MLRFYTLKDALLVLMFAIIIFLLGWVAYNASPSATESTPAFASVTETWPTPPPSPTATPTATTPASATPSPTITPTPTVTPTPTPTPIVVGWQDLGQLTTVEYTLQTVVEYERERTAFGLNLPPERILMLAVGNVEAGIDMRQIEENDIRIDGKSVSVTLPRAQVTSVEILPSETQIFDSNRSWFLPDYAGLEVGALDTARIQMESWAVNRSNVLNRAEDFARLRLTAFLRQLGFEDISIEFDALESENE
jgi:hypothetical protein